MILRTTGEAAIKSVDKDGEANRCLMDTNLIHKLFCMHSKQSNIFPNMFFYKSPFVFIHPSTLQAPIIVWSRLCCQAICIENTIGTRHREKIRSL